MEPKPVSQDESEKLKALKNALNELLDVSKVESVISTAVPLGSANSGTAAHSSPKTALLHIGFQENIPNVLGLAKFLWSQALNYALSRRRRLAFREAMSNSSDADVSLVAELYNQVRQTFIEFRASYPQRASEVGEVLAYCIALSHLQASQILAKMSLKTSSNMPVHGLDGIHAKVEKSALTMYFLESKLSKTANDGAREFSESVSPYLNGTKQYAQEYSLIGDLGNLDTLSKEARALALEQFDIFSTPSVPKRERSVGVICYSEKKLFSKVPALNETESIDFYEKSFRALYSAELFHHQTAARTHLEAHKVDPQRCLVFFVAVPDVDQLREAFYSVMGINTSVSTQPKPEKKAAIKSGKGKEKK